MAISKKNKNRALIDGKEYLWWVFDEHDQGEFHGIQAMAVSPDQACFFKYGLQQSAKDRKVVLGLRNYDKVLHLACPVKFENEAGILTRSGLIRLVQWCKQGKHQIHFAFNRENKEMTGEDKLAVLRELRQIICTD